jgi:CDP-4-dehydro-6-deoxyglucose reductase
MGEFVLREDSPHPLLFLACDTGFAPIKSLIEHAMALEAAEAIYLYWIATADGGHYLQNQCRAWADALDNFYFVPLVGAGDYGTALGKIAATHGKLGEFDVYAAGPQGFLAAAQNHLLSRGLPPAQLVAQVTR